MLAVFTGRALECPDQKRFLPLKGKNKVQECLDQNYIIQYMVMIVLDP